MDVMIDIETLGKGKTAAILSIAAVPFRRNGSTEGVPEPFYANVDLQSCLDAGLTVDGDTIYWWLNQEQQARERLGDPLPESIWDTLLKLDRYVRLVIWDDGKVWSQGSNFDIAILENAYRIAQITIPWEYNAPRDTRTLYDIAAVDYKAFFDARGHQKHDALEDAKAQVELVQECFALLKRRSE